jgi:signal transduction histidine kinase
MPDDTSGDDDKAHPATRADTPPGDVHGSPTPDDLADAEDRVERLETAFLASISHELRSPLAAIKGYAATLRRHGHKLGRAEKDEYLRAIEESSDRLELLIARLMELSRLEAGALAPIPAPLDVVPLVKEAILAAEQRADMDETAEIFTFVAPEQDYMPLALADLRMQRDVLDIVLENAVKYSPGGGMIRVTLRTENTMLIISVSDDGIGIPPEHLIRIFRRFHRVDTRLTREVGGVGLGLAIAKRIMELQGGEIWAESEPGRGSVFSMALPLLRPYQRQPESTVHMNDMNAPTNSKG